MNTIPMYIIPNCLNWESLEGERDWKWPKCVAMNTSWTPFPIVYASNDTKKQPSNALQSLPTSDSPTPSLVLPFYEVIDWRQAALLVDERQLLQVPHLMRSVSAYRLLAMRSQTRFLWETYFNTVEKIVMTTLEIVRRRLEHRRNVVTWSLPPGGVVSQPSYSTDLLDYPFYRPLQVPRPSVLTFTAVVQCETPVVRASAPLARLVRNIAAAPHLAKVSQPLEGGQAPFNVFCLCKQPQP